MILNTLIVLDYLSHVVHVQYPRHEMVCRCGPCKVMLPELEKMAQEKGEKAKFVKFNCNAKNKELGQSLGIRVAPLSSSTRTAKRWAEL